MYTRVSAIEIYLAGVESVKPGNLIPGRMSLSRNIMKIDDKSYDLTAIDKIFVVGVGKASASMASSVESILGSRINAGHVVTKYGHSVPLKYINITEAGHPVPDENGIMGTESILSVVNSAQENDLIIFLVSGGGSALLADVPEGCSLNDLRMLNTTLLQSGASIKEINCIRKHLSGVKGGMLARAAYPATLLSLIISDVIGDPLDVIASGPTVPDPTTYTDALEIIDRLNVKSRIPEKLMRTLLDGYMGKRPETLKESDPCFLKTGNIIIGNNVFAIQNSRLRAESFGYRTEVITSKLDGDVNDVARYIWETALGEKKKFSGNKICLLFGGEPTVKINGEGLGGRNQHLALLMAKLIKNSTGITFLSGGTDGTDGPTDAAGAVVDTNTLLKASYAGLDYGKYLDEFDSYNFFMQEGGLVKTGPTQTNVMDLMVLLID